VRPPPLSLVHFSFIRSSKLLSLLAASAGIGYYLRSRKDEQLLQDVTPEKAPFLESTQQVRDKIELLRRREARLVEEEKELRDKLDRVKKARSNV